jgi:hypothetical protein
MMFGWGVRLRKGHWWRSLGLGALEECWSSIRSSYGEELN